MGNVFEDADGNPDYKALTIHYRAQAQALNSSKPNSHRINCGRVLPPILSLDNELRSTSYQMQKANWLDFFEKSKMHDSEGLAFLKEQSIPDKTLKILFLFVSQWIQLLFYWTHSLGTKKNYPKPYLQ